MCRCVLLNIIIIHLYILLITFIQVKMSHLDVPVDSGESLSNALKHNDDRLQSSNSKTVIKTLKNESETSTSPINEQSTTEINVTSSDPSNKIIESDASDIKIGRTIPKASRELKSILALSKEARLDTNIVHKRKSVEPGKLNESTLPKRRNSTGSTSDKKDNGKKSTGSYMFISQKMQCSLYCLSYYRFIIRK